MLILEPGEFKMTEDDEKAFLQSCAEGKNRVFFLGFVEGELVAVCHMSASDRAKIRHRGKFGLTVVRQCRGRGVGGAMLDHLIAWARANPILTKVELDVHVDNERAIGLYLSRGFVKEGAVRNAVLIEGQYFDQFCMGLDVSV